MTVNELSISTLDFCRRVLPEWFIRKKGDEQERTLLKKIALKLNELSSEEIDVILDYDHPNFKKIIEIAQENDQNAIEVLFKKYKKMIEAAARKYFLPGSEFEDLRQEAMLGFWDAIKKYKPLIIDNFSYFAKLCTGREVSTAVRDANRNKHSSLNSYISIFEPRFIDKKFITYISPETIFLAKEELLTFLQALSKREQLTIIYFNVMGFSYVEVAAKLKIDYVSVGNAHYRAVKKLEKLFSSII